MRAAPLSGGDHQLAPVQAGAPAPDRLVEQASGSLRLRRRPENGGEPVADGRMKRLHRVISWRLFVPRQRLDLPSSLDIKLLRCKNSLPPGDH